MSYHKKTSATSSNKWGRRYPWNVWFGLGSFVLERGVHYNGRTDTMMSQVRQQAAKRKLKITVGASDDAAYILVTVWLDGRKV